MSVVVDRELFIDVADTIGRSGMAPKEERLDGVTLAVLFAELRPQTRALMDVVARCRPRYLKDPGELVGVEAGKIDRVFASQ